MVPQLAPALDCGNLCLNFQQSSTDNRKQLLRSAVTFPISTFSATIPQREPVFVPVGFGLLYASDVTADISLGTANIGLGDERLL